MLVGWALKTKEDEEAGGSQRNKWSVGSFELCRVGREKGREGGGREGGMEGRKEGGESVE